MEHRIVYPQYGATKTPHIYLLQKTKKGNVVKYIGAIDDNYKDAEAVTEKYVEDAVDTLLKGGEIKVKTTPKPKKSDTLKKRSILRMIRNQQQNRYDNLFDKKKDVSPETVDTPRKKEFEEAQNYLNSLKEKREIQNKLKHNNTIRRNTHDNIDSMLQDNFQKQPSPVAQLRSKRGFEDKTWFFLATFPA